MKFADLHLPARLLRAARLAPWLAALVCGTAFAGVTDIYNAPLFTSSSNAVKPNIMYILDDSGSMLWDFLPDDAGTYKPGWNGHYGRTAAHCNGIAYDPSVTYNLPVLADGTSKGAGDVTQLKPGSGANTSTVPNTYYQYPPPDPSGFVGTFAAVLSNTGTAASSISWPTGVGANFSVNASTNWSVGSLVTVYGSGSGSSTQFFVGTITSNNGSTIKGTTTFVVGSALASGQIARGAANSYYTYTGAEPDLNYVYQGGGAGRVNNNFYAECHSTIGSTPGSGVFKLNVVGGNSAEAQNYANWYQYYRTRMLMTQSAMSLSFKNVDNRYRVGFSTITYTGATEGTSFVSIRDFNGPTGTLPSSPLTQKEKFYNALYAATPQLYTPLRGALSKAGQYYAHMAPGQASADDPMQYSCQRNYAIMSTDGYWNTPGESGTYSAFQLNNKDLVANQDNGATPRPMFDGGSVTVTTTDTWTITNVSTVVNSTPTTTTSTSTRSTITVAPITSGQQEYVYSFTSDPVLSLNSSAIGRPSNCTTACTVTVTVSNHGLSVGDQFRLSGTGNGYSGTFTVNKVTTNTFSYVVNAGSRPPNPSGSYLYFPPGATSCSAAGQAASQKQLQTRDQTSSTTYTEIQTTTTVTSQSQTVTTTTGTPHTQVSTTVNGVPSSNTGDLQGVAKVLNTQNSSVSTGTPTSSVAVATNTVGPISGFSSWVNSGGPVADSCYSSLPATVTSTISVSKPQTVTTTGPVIANGTPTKGAQTTTPLSSSPPVESAHISNSSTQTNGGNANTLADVAMYYYQTDLRDGTLNNCTGGVRADGTKGDVCTNNVPSNTNDAAHSFGDSANWQHMTLFGVGLVSGTMRYDPNYMTNPAGDFYKILNGGKDWPAPSNISGDGGPENIDDLWHAAVNGRGQYFLAGNPTALSRSLDSTLSAIKAVTGAASAASTSSLQPVQGDNAIYVAQFTTQEWVGDVLSYTIDPVSGQISQTPVWSARTQLDALNPASRAIYYADKNGASTLRAFNYTNLTVDGYNQYFDNFCSMTGVSGSGKPQQCPSFSATDKAAANLGLNLVTYLTGDQTLSAYYRVRQNELGDIINASPLYVGKPSFKYTENGYQSFASSNAGRQAVVLAAANDGMLHAFDRDTGNELWAFIPTAVMPNLYKLADTNYPSFHQYYVDGSPQIADIYVDDNDGKGAHWKSIVVGGLNDGGRSYYALDVTDPKAPKLLWEFSDDNLGLTYGNPVITKRFTTDGLDHWVVVFGSGYNNINNGDGNGRLYVIDANTGKPITQIATFTSGTTPAGSTSTPSGLAHINPWIDSETDNTAKRFYGGDLLGNLWRFDLDNQVQPNGKALLLAQLTGPTGAAQPITTKPALAEVNYNGGKYPVAYVATGRYLGNSDLNDSNVQSVYAIKDPLTATALGVVRSRSDFVTQTITASGTSRTSTGKAVDWSTKQGWFADLPAGERVSVNPQLALTTLFVGSNLPNKDVCSVGGQSFLYQFDIGTGSSTSTYVGNVMIQGLTLVQLTTGAADGSVVTIITRSDGTLQSVVGSPTTSIPSLRRSSWRELVE